MLSLYLTRRKALLKTIRLDLNFLSQILIGNKYCPIGQDHYLLVMSSSSKSFSERKAVIALIFTIASSNSVNFGLESSHST